MAASVHSLLGGGSKYTYNKYTEINNSKMVLGQAVTIYNCSYACMHEYTYIHIHTHVLTYIHIHTHTHTYIHQYIHMHTYIHTYTHTYIHIYRETHIRTDK